MKKALKTLAIALLLTATALPVHAQEESKRHLPDYDNETFHFGFLLGFNEMKFSLKTIKDYQSIAQPFESWPNLSYTPMDAKNYYVQNIEPLQAPGFTIGITSNLRLGRHFNLRLIPSLSFGERRMHYIIGIEDLNGNITTRDLTKTLNTTFVEFPLNIKYRILRYKNTGPYLMGGINPIIDLSSKKANYYHDLYISLPISYLAVKRFDCTAEFGFGLDIYTKKFKLGIEAKMSYGLLDIVEKNNFIYTAPIDELCNRRYQVSLLFE